MRNIRRNPFSVADELQRDINRFFDGSFPHLVGNNDKAVEKNWRPAEEIREEKQSYIIALDLPGIEPEQLQVSTKDNVLSIKGERKTGTDEQTVRRSEVRYGVFLREFIVPEDADLENIVAKSRLGVMEVTIPKSQQANQTRHIEVKVG